MSGMPSCRRDSCYWMSPLLPHGSPMTDTHPSGTAGYITFAFPPTNTTQPRRKPDGACSQKRAKQLSLLWNDRPVSAMDTAIYWVEYVAKHEAVLQLRPASISVPFYQYILIDVWLTLESGAALKLK
ncbi:UDP-glucuronosyltransferase 1-3 [Eumeta japonica]|uniref:UDP-glucuronosyltransferase 1-3 n=1 Tax=Eumeta variegata TaxID=151549 RepID=A0A4C1WGB4_EUMVA|nr:UDP-glucuronosyltransferase 1-3 [Eumeta japonica]